jgi:hypothetical protein
MRTVLAQLLSYVPKREFTRCVRQHRGNRNVRTFTCWDQFVCMLIAQLGRKESLREIEVCVRKMRSELYYAGLRGCVSRSTLADANEGRPSSIYRDFCHILIKKARLLYAGESFLQDLNNLVYVLDSTNISLPLSMCPWAYTGSRPEAGVKVHTQLDLRGPIPSFLHISSVKMRDNFFLDSITIEPGAFYVMDKAYFDLIRLYIINQRKGFFVTRPLRHVKYRRCKQLSRLVKASSIRSDYLVRFSSRNADKNYPDHLRKIVYLDPETQNRLTFLTNNFELPAQTVADLYKARWQIEVFFKWIKQNLHIVSFFGRSNNAVQTQIWIAVSSYLLVAIARGQLNIKAPLTEIINFLPSAIFVKMPIFSAFDNKVHPNNTTHYDNQLKLL